MKEKDEYMEIVKSAGTVSTVICVSVGVIGLVLWFFELF